MAADMDIDSVYCMQTEIKKGTQNGNTAIVCKCTDMDSNRAIYRYNNCYMELEVTQRGTLVMNVPFFILLQMCFYRIL